MGRAPKTKVRAVRIPGRKASPKLPAIVQMQKTEEFLHEAQRQAGKMRRLLWLAVKVAGGRIEITPDDYKAAMELPANETNVGVETDTVANRIVLVFHDAEGKRLPESEPNQIIITDRP